MAKATFRYDASAGSFAPVPHFFVSTVSTPTGTTSFTSDAKGSMKTLLDLLPSGSRVEAVALFPCFMRGKNAYGANNVEPDAVGELLPDAPIFGMFCHGELGPGTCMGFAPADGAQDSCRQHSMTSIVALHASKTG